MLAVLAARPHVPAPEDEPEPGHAPPLTAPKRPAPAPLDEPEPGHVPVAPMKRPPPAPPPRAVPQGPVPWPTRPDEILPDQSVGHGASVPGSTAPPPPPGPAAPVALGPAVVPASGPHPRRTTFDLWLDGRVLVDRDLSGEARLRWLLAGLDHRPTEWLRLYGAVELESGTTFGLEQLHVGLTPDPAIGLRAGLLLLPLGITNLHHNPTTYLTVDRPLTDLLIIPTTWRELGVELFGELGGALRYQLQLVSGLDATGFAAQAPLAGGRGNGRTVAMHDPAFVGRLELAVGGLTVGGSGYYGAADAGHPELDGVRVGVGEGDVSFRGAGFELRAQFAELFIVDSWKVNDYLGLLGQDAVPARGRGLYALVGYDLLQLADPPTTQALVVFAGYENVNPRSRMSVYNYNPPTITGPGELSPAAPSSAKSIVRGGFCYRPLSWLAVKGDIQYALAGTTAMPVTPTPAMGAPGTPVPLSDDLAAASRARTLFGLALALAF
jgi:hypothetical protein